MRKIYAFCGEGSKTSVTSFMQGAHPKIKEKYKFVLGVVADERNQLKEPYVKHFSIERYKRLSELRLKASKTMIRIIYYEEDDKIILLHAFIKKDKRDTEQALEYALKVIERIEAEEKEDSPLLAEVMLP